MLATTATVRLASQSSQWSVHVRGGGVAMIRIRANLGGRGQEEEKDEGEEE